MKTSEILKLIDDREFLDKIYHFSYHRCSTSFEAEDLCSEIIAAVLSAVKKQAEVENFYAFVWRIARGVYADHCEKKSKDARVISMENGEFLPAATNEIDDFIEEVTDQEHIRRILSEIAFLSRAYREVMVLYYMDDMKIKDIAKRLHISETTVKQRLFSARNTVREEVKAMNNRNLSLKPIHFAMSGTGNPCGNDPRIKVERNFSKNLIYLCKDKPRSAKELSDALCVPMPYIEEELEIQCRGENGTYGFLHRLENGKYVSNALVVDYKEYDEANKIYEKYLPEYCEILKKNLEKDLEKILSFPYLSPQRDLRFILWLLINRMGWDFAIKVNREIAEKYFSDIPAAKREFSCAAIAFTDEDTPDFGFLGCDGIDATSVGGYKRVFVSNMYDDEHLDAHFHCGHNLSRDEKLLMTLRAIGGLPIADLFETEKEIAAKAIECGYLYKNGDVLLPKIVVMDDQYSPDFFGLARGLNEGAKTLFAKIAKEIAQFMRVHIPEHLLCEYQIYTQLIASGRATSYLVKECIKAGLLLEPEQRLDAIGVLMTVEK